MELLGMEITNIYLVLLIITGLSTILYIFFSDLTEGADSFPLLDPAVLLAFMTLASATGYILELTTDWSHLLIFIIAIGIAVLLDTLFYYFVLLPLKSAEVSLAYTEDSLAGQVGKVVVPIPKDGFGEIVIETVNGLIAKRATGFENQPIDFGKEVLVIEVREGTCFVQEYEPFRFS